MINRIANCGLNWDVIAAERIEAGQQWILSAMGRHGATLITMLWRILGNEQDVCDAYQATFLQLAHYDGQRKPDNVKAYIFRTATNVAISMLRRKETQNKFIRTAIATQSSTLDRCQSSNEQELDIQHLLSTLRTHIMRLPEYLRNVITLHDLGELPYEQVGRILQIPPGTARVYRYKAVQLLALWMSEKKNESK